MSIHRRGWITVRQKYTGPAKILQWFIGAWHFLVGGMFVWGAITVILHSFLFSLILLAIGVLTIVRGARIIRKGFAERVTYDADKMNRHTVSFRPNDPDHMHITGAGLSPKKQMEQLEILKNAGLLTDEEYDERRKEILREL